MSTIGSLGVFCADAANSCENISCLCRSCKVEKKRPDLVEKKKHIYLNDIPFFDQIIFLGCSNSSLFLESELRPQ